MLNDTYALNTNLSLICRNGTEVVGRLTKSPYISTTGIPKPLHRRDDGCGQQQQKQKQRPHRASSIKHNKKRNRPGAARRSRGVVRFSPETLDRVEQKDQIHRVGFGAGTQKRRRFRPSTDGAFWYSKGELRDIQRSCVRTIKNHALGVQQQQEEDGTPATDASIDTLDRYYPSNQKRRRLARSQMYQTIKAVREFEKSTNTKAPPELLATLLQRYSAQKSIEAKAKALRTADECALSGPC
eukprot:CAMPEP_0197182328 /NCGR_PEP_ID=MMETSP1423-20130617/6324_1 /TAXON_ID=476441 /ORGANISM="Pseudo-nitzschia heimii, Strain UNC1101" /LENGTH=240 /DNA_ID=CAMNT_0042632737 /DNA_START=128 /DNA_END=850 /DNA_ORIENTATION=+